MEKKVFHVTTRENWQQYATKSHYYNESLKTDGFIHCAKAEQLIQVLNSFFKGQENLVILEIDTLGLAEGSLKVEPPFETPMAPIEFPHIYAEVPIEAITKSIEIDAEKDGTFTLPDHLF
jgi:uncharacterized protein (DUF952 family)